ncbi:MAG: HIT family protein, partial [Actinobacteria bacterium]|nr:HIT family protein [Actinomycetota bacterium]
MASNDQAFAIRDRFPVSRGHTLVIPKRIVANWWQADERERSAMFHLVDEVKADLDEHFSPTGYNVGFNAGDSAGQTINHLHVHVIPRYDGDMADPTGGIRHVIPEKANYLASNTAQTIEPTQLAQDVSDQLDTSAFLQRLLAVVDEGRRSATYKPALLLALTELATERGSGFNELRLPLNDVADRIMELYWPHTREYPAAQVVLNQVAGGQGRVLGALADLRASSAASANSSLAAARAADPVGHSKARSKVARALAKQPVPRLQRPGTDASVSHYPRFLFDDSRFVAERGALDNDPEIVLLPGIAEALA